MNPLIVLATVLLAIIIGILSTRILGKDNVVEQFAEVVIKIETGEDVDLSQEEKTN